MLTWCALTFMKRRKQAAECCVKYLSCSPSATPSMSWFDFRFRIFAKESAYVRKLSNCFYSIHHIRNCHAPCTWQPKSNGNPITFSRTQFDRVPFLLSNDWLAKIRRSKEMRREIEIEKKKTNTKLWAINNLVFSILSLNLVRPVLLYAHNQTHVYRLILPVRNGNKKPPKK